MKRQWRPGAKGWLAVLAVAALLISACAKAIPTPTPGAATPTPTPQTTPIPIPGATPVATPVVKPRPTGELRMATASFGTESLDPTHIPTSGQIYLAPMYDHLVGMGADGKYSKETGLARDWKASPDGQTWTFYLRQGVKFHDGTELTAEDVKFTLERFMQPGPTSSRAGYMKTTLNQISAPERYTAVVKLNEADFMFDYLVSGFGGGEGMIIPKRYFEQVGEAGFGVKPMGSGPYKFTDRMLGSFIRFEANEEHWGRVPAYKKFTFFVVPEASTRVALLRTGQADVVEIVSESAADVEKAGFGIKVNPGILTPLWNFGKPYEPAFVYHDKRVRQALALTFNQAEIVEHILGRGGEAAATPLFTQASEGYDPALKPYPYDLAKAKELLAEAKIDPSKVELKLWSYVRPGIDVPKVIEAAAGYWMKLGFKVKIVPTDFGAFRAKYQAQTQRFDPPAELFIITSASRPNVTAVLTTYFVSEKLGGLVNRWGNVFPEIDKWFLAATGSPDPAERHKVLRELNRFVYENYLTMSVGRAAHLFGINQKRVGEWVLPLGYQNIWSPETIAPPKG